MLSRQLALGCNRRPSKPGACAQEPGWRPAAARGEAFPVRRPGPEPIPRLPGPGQRPKQAQPGAIRQQKGLSATGAAALGTTSAMPERFMKTCSGHCVLGCLSVDQEPLHPGEVLMEMDASYKGSSRGAALAVLTMLAFRPRGTEYPERHSLEQLLWSPERGVSSALAVLFHAYKLNE